MITEKIRVCGTAIKPGVSRNGIRYLPEELKNFGPTMTSRPILKDHNASVDSTVGVVEMGNCNNEGIVKFDGWINEDGTLLL